MAESLRVVSRRSENMPVRVFDAESGKKLMTRNMKVETTVANTGLEDVGTRIRRVFVPVKFDGDGAFINVFTSEASFRHWPPRANVAAGLGLIGNGQ